MFSSRKGNLQTNSNSIDTLIAPSTNITGDINASGTVRIDGNYKGNVRTESEVIVGKSGIIVGNVEAKNITIAGTVDGNIKCRGLLEILNTGKLTGDIEVKQLSIGINGVFNGRCTMVGNNDIETELTEYSD